MDQYGYANISCIIFLETLFCAILFKLMLNAKKIPTYAVFDRSFTLMQLANLTNYFESILNIIQGMLYLSVERDSKLFQFIILVMLIYASRLYSALMSLRIIRMYMLNMYRKGEFSRKKLQFLSSPVQIMLISNIYAIIVALTIALIVTLRHLDYNYLSLINNICFFYESLIFFSLSTLAYKINSHPTLTTEYLMYSIFWITGSINPLDFESKWFLVAPIRNNTLLLVSYISLKFHAESIRPPLPFNIEPENIFQIAELYSDFMQFVETSQNDEDKKSCLVLSELVKVDISETCEEIRIKVQEIKEVDLSLVELIQNKMINEAKQRVSLEIQNIVKEYIESDRFKEFKRDYFIRFS